MRENWLQIDIATGRLTLPVVILISLIVWGIGYSEGTDLANMAITATCGYLLIEMNTTFTLIRTRTTFPISIYWYLMAIFYFLHPFEWGSFSQLALLFSVFQLFYSYESNHAPTHVFHAFFFIGLGSLGFPQLVYFTPLWFISTIAFRAISVKSFSAGLLGLLTPYWFLFGYAFWNDEIHLFLVPLQEMQHVYPIDYTSLETDELSATIFTTFLLIISSIHYLQTSYLDKTRTRIYLSFLVYAGIWTSLFLLLQPQHLHQLLPIQLICTAVLSGHLFTLTRNRFSGLFFIVTFVTTILLSIYNLWMQFFSF